MAERYTIIDGETGAPFIQEVYDSIEAAEAKRAGLIEKGVKNTLAIIPVDGESVDVDVIEDSGAVSEPVAETEEEKSDEPD